MKEKAPAKPAAALAASALLSIMAAAGSAHAASVDVFAEGAYTADNLVVYVYANIASPIVSQGVRITYNTAEATLTRATKNTTTWYLGATPPGHAYMDPDTSTPGEVVIIGGRLDTDNPTAGVSGSRVLLGTVSFNRTSHGTPVANPEATFGVTLGLGKGGNFANFADTSGTELDDTNVSFTGVTIRERGDANADNVITNLDLFAVRNMISNGQFVIYGDCNGDGNITTLDLMCVKNKI